MIQCLDDMRYNLVGLLINTGSVVIVKGDTAVVQYKCLDVLHLAVGLVDCGTKCLFVVIAASCDMRDGYSYHTVVYIRDIDEMQSSIDEMTPSVSKHVHLAT